MTRQSATSVSSRISSGRKTKIKDLSRAVLNSRPQTAASRNTALPAAQSYTDMNPYGIGTSTTNLTTNYASKKVLRPASAADLQYSSVKNLRKIQKQTVIDDVNEKIQI